MEKLESKLSAEVYTIYHPKNVDCLPKGTKAVAVRYDEHGNVRDVVYLSKSIINLPANIIEMMGVGKLERDVEKAQNIVEMLKG